jgi:hypothetical protein
MVGEDTTFWRRIEPLLLVFALLLIGVFVWQN